MKKALPLLAICLIPFFSCKKDHTPDPIVGTWTWTVQYTDSPDFIYTPASTGIHELLTINADGTYSVSDNGTIANTGTYKLKPAKSANGASIHSILFTNSRRTDSTEYYQVVNNNDSLFFGGGLSGIVGGGARHYGR